MHNIANILKINFLILVCISMSSYAQDIHFSQFYNSPLNLNPALAGQFNGDYRFVGNYRNQWSSVTVPYQTFSFSADASNFLKKKSVGAGIIFNHDNTGDSRFKTTVLNVVGNYKLALNSDSNQYLGGGIAIGFTNKNLSFAPLRFDAQYNGFRYDRSLSNNETFTASSQTFMNIHAGLSYGFQIADRKRIDAGVSVFNLTSPKETYLGDNGVRLDRRYTVHGSFQYPINDKIEVIPSFLYMNQGTYNQFVMGALGKYIVSDFRGSYQAAYAGVFYRNQDAGYFTAGYEFNNWNVSISYDVNTSSLQPASNSRGGIELAAIYILKLFKPLKVKHRICPDYM